MYWDVTGLHFVELGVRPYLFVALLMFRCNALNVLVEFINCGGGAFTRSDTLVQRRSAQSPGYTLLGLDDYSRLVLVFMLYVSKVNKLCIILLLSVCTLSYVVADND